MFYRRQSRVRTIQALHYLSSEQCLSQIRVMIWECQIYTLKVILRSIILSLLVLQGLKLSIRKGHPDMGDGVNPVPSAAPRLTPP